MVVLVSAPFLPGWAGGLAYLVGSFVCHQIPERSFHVETFQLPVCARCLGLYASGALGSLGGVWFAAGPHGTAASARASLDGPVLRRLAVIAAIPTLSTVALEAAGAWHPSNITRAVAGVPLGALVGVVVVNALATVHYGECVPPRPTVPRPPPSST
jgi:uncharacterized membrane protein